MWCRRTTRRQASPNTLSTLKPYAEQVSKYETLGPRSRASDSALSDSTTRLRPGPPIRSCVRGRVGGAWKELGGGQQQVSE